jgi:hypothetical protein
MRHARRVAGTLAALAVFAAANASSQTTTEQQVVQRPGIDQTGVQSTPYQPGTYQAYQPGALQTSQVSERPEAAVVTPPGVVLFPPSGKIEGRVAMLDESSRVRATMWLDNGAALRIAEVTPTLHEILRPGSYVSAVVEPRAWGSVVTDLRIEPELQAP